MTSSDSTVAPANVAKKKTPAKMAGARKATKVTSRSGRATLPPELAAEKLLDGSLNHKDFGKLSVPAQVLLTEVLLERDRDSYFDDNGIIWSGNLEGLIVEILGVPVTRARTIMKSMRKAGSYTSPGRGGKVVFKGSEQAKAILSQRQQMPMPDDLQAGFDPAEPTTAVLPGGLYERDMELPIQVSTYHRHPSSQDLVEVLATGIAEEVWRRSGYSRSVVERTVAVLQEKLFNL